MAHTDGIAAFRDYIAGLGFDPPERIEPGRWMPFSTNGKHRDSAGRVKLFPDLEGGIVWDHRSGESWTWQAKRDHPRTAQEQAAWREKCERARLEAQAEREREMKQTAERAKAAWDAAKPAEDSHPYLVSKAVKCHGLRLYRGPIALNGMRCDGALIVPRRNVGGELVSLSFIAGDGEKRYLNGPRPPGSYFSIGKPDGTICIAEGYATGASIHEATGHAVAVAFDAGNLEPTAKALRSKFPEARLILCADNDIGDGPNRGIEDATKAARAVGGALAIPDMGGAKCDFNDLAAKQGAEAVRASIGAAMAPDMPAHQPPAENRSSAILASAQAASNADWPEPLADEAMQGLAGDIVRAIEPHTESDPAALLIQVLVMFGALVGKGPHIRVEGDEHHARLFTILTGRSSKGRKGTSLGRVRELFAPIVNQPRFVEGLSSGEGLKYAVRDPVRKSEKDKSGFIAEVEIDAGVTDKRLLVTESEFAQVLRVCARPGNTLSATIRSAWDSGNLQTLTKNDPIVATGAHVSIIGHITADELRAELTATDSANGFANRFLFMATERSKMLPFGGGDLDSAIKSELSSRIARAAEAARQRGAMRLTQAARDGWEVAYPVLSSGQPGLLGAVTARAEAQTIRLALIYALMDEAEAIDLPHLRGALAVWERCESSARFVFGAALGDRIADLILRTLHAQGAMTRTQISKLFSRNETAERIGAALALLESRGLAKCRKSDGQGRPSELWEAA